MAKKKGIYETQVGEDEREEQEFPELYKPLAVRAREFKARQEAEAARPSTPSRSKPVDWSVADKPALAATNDRSAGQDQERRSEPPGEHAAIKPAEAPSSAHEAMAHHADEMERHEAIAKQMSDALPKKSLFTQDTPEVAALRKQSDEHQAAANIHRDAAIMAGNLAHHGVDNPGRKEMSAKADAASKALQTGERGGSYYLGPQGTKIYVSKNPGLNIGIEATPSPPLPPPCQQVPFMIKGLESLYRDPPGTTPTPAPQQPLSPAQAAQEANGGNDPRLDAMALQAAGIANPAIKSRLK